MTEEEKMKRSEMILAIDRQFPTLHIECDIDQLLQFLESQGMHPPTRIVQRKVWYSEDGETRFERSISAYEWEPEE